MKHKNLFSLLCRMVWLWVAGVIAMPVVAQRHVIYNQRIASLQVVAGQRWQEMPVAQLGEPVHIDFDDMTHDYENIVKPTGRSRVRSLPAISYRDSMAN